MPEGGVLTVVVVAACGREIARWPVVAPRADLAVVDALARWQLVARRHGCSIRLLGVGADLADLLGFVGLAALLPSDR